MGHLPLEKLELYGRLAGIYAVLTSPVVSLIILCAIHQPKNISYEVFFIAPMGSYGCPNENC